MIKLTISKVIVVAAGSSRRMGGTDKIFENLVGKPVIAHTLNVFENSKLIDGIILVLSDENLEKGSKLIKEYKYKKVEYICSGGSTRQQSVGNGLKHVGKCDFILVHDGARPCVTEESISKGIREAEKIGIAIAGCPVSDTIKSVDKNSQVIKTLDRSMLRAIHTPQVFKSDILRKIHENASADTTDDAGLAERMGFRVEVYDDSYENIKITTKEDLIAVKIILSKYIILKDI